MELERFGKYELLERLGQGGMGEVWKARDTQLRRYVAVKFLHANLQSNADFVSHFMREAQFVASLHHPNIIQVHDFQLTDARVSGAAAYMVMDYVEGGTMGDYIRATSRKGLFPSEADIVYLFTTISLALDYAHQKGMVHRDIKPANILLDKRATSKPMGEPILTDFGIAKLQGGGATTVTHTAIGTPLYISPEQAKGQVANERSDLYSLGVILYEIVTGITPFRGDNPIAIMMQHVHEMPTPPALINPKISPALSEVVVRSIAKDPDARFPTASAMTVALAQALQVAVPSSLSKPDIMKDQPGYNPLQPSRSLSDMMPYPQTLAASPAAPYTPVGADVARPYPQAGFQLNSPAALTPAKDDRALQSPLVSPLPAVQPPRLRRGLFIALLACIVLLLVGVGAFTVTRLLSQKNAPTTQNSSGSVFGHITFLASPNASHNTYDQLQVTLNNIQSPPAGKTYYAWLENSNSEANVIPHWQLQVANGSVHATYQGDAQHADLLAQNTLFLVTAEDTGTTPIIPSPDLNTHLFYADISHSTSSSPIFEVKQCPSGGTNNSANPCI
jgi:eukaryotic-like serine/threonine-protein kinase